MIVVNEKYVMQSGQQSKAAISKSENEITHRRLCRRIPLKYLLQLISTFDNRNIAGEA